MNTETPIASATNPLLPEKDCYGTDSQVATLNVITDHQRKVFLSRHHADEVLLAQLIEHRHNRQAPDEFRDHSEADEILGGKFH